METPFTPGRTPSSFYSSERPPPLSPHRSIHPHQRTVRAARPVTAFGPRGRVRRPGWQVGSTVTTGNAVYTRPIRSHGTASARRSTSRPRATPRRRPPGGNGSEPRAAAWQGNRTTSMCRGPPNPEPQALRRGRIRACTRSSDTPRRHAGQGEGATGECVGYECAETFPGRDVAAVAWSPTGSVADLTVDAHGL
jgi:hypothetical protein